MTTWLSKLEATIKARTKGPWPGITIRWTKSEAWLVFGDDDEEGNEPPEVTSADDDFICLMGTVADELLEVVRAAENFYGTHESLGWGGHSKIGEALSALKAKLEKG